MLSPCRRARGETEGGRVCVRRVCHGSGPSAGFIRSPRPDPLPRMQGSGARNEPAGLGGRRRPSLRQSPKIKRFVPYEWAIIGISEGKWARIRRKPAVLPPVRPCIHGVPLRWRHAPWWFPALFPSHPETSSENRGESRSDGLPCAWICTAMNRERDLSAAAGAPAGQVRPRSCLHLQLQIELLAEPGDLGCDDRPAVRLAGVAPEVVLVAALGRVELRHGSQLGDDPAGEGFGLVWKKTSSSSR